eukprot:scaffold650409_cov55-Prasinocladus_malaysianus.AAC.1
MAVCYGTPRVFAQRCRHPRRRIDDETMKAALYYQPYKVQHRTTGVKLWNSIDHRKQKQCLIRQSFDIRCSAPGCEQPNMSPSGKGGRELLERINSARPCGLVSDKHSLVKAHSTVYCTARVGVDIVTLDVLRNWQTKWCVGASAAATLVARHDLPCAWCLLCSIFSVIVCKALKRTLNHERPEENPGKTDPGMPSSHAN